MAGSFTYDVFLSQALEQILIGYVMSICGEFKDNEGQPSGKKIY